MAATAGVETLVRGAPRLRWYGGVRVPHPDFAGFVAAILDNPGDDTARLIFADRLGDCERTLVDPKFADYLRLPGTFRVERTGRHTSLLYVLWGSGVATGGVGYLWLAHLRLDRVPVCKTCKAPHRVGMRLGEGLTANGGVWACPLYQYE